MYPDPDKLHLMYQYRCYFCQYKWGELYLDAIRRPKEEGKGDVCPRCHVIQGKVEKGEEWRMHFRKFCYGIASVSDLTELEPFLEKNFKWKPDKEWVDDDKLRGKKREGNKKL